MSVGPSSGVHLSLGLLPLYMSPRAPSALGATPRSGMRPWRSQRTMMRYAHDSAQDHRVQLLPELFLEYLYHDSIC